MGLFDRRSKPKHRVPDLSRYSQYNQQEPSNRESVVSTGAAATALRSHSLTTASYNPHNSHYNNYQNQRYSNRQQSQPRTMSMTSHRANSLSSLNGQDGYRGFQRANSLRSNGSRMSGQPDKIIVRTTKTKDQYGRTTSITTETIQQLGSFELVKKEIKEVPLQPPPSVQLNHPYAGCLMENELGSILEEEDDELERDESLYSATVNTKKVNNRGVESQDDRLFTAPSIANERAKSPVRSILKNGEKRPPTREKKVLVLGDDEEISDGGSVYSDALDLLPQSHKMRKRVSLDNIKVSEDTGFAAKVKNIDRPSSRLSRGQERSSSVPAPAATPTPAKSSKSQMTEEEIYELAYQVAMKKVYGENSDSMPQEPKKGGFKTYSLRGDNSLKNKNNTKSSPRVSGSRTNSLTSLTKPPSFYQASGPSTPIENPTHSPEMEPTPRYAAEETSLDVPLSQSSNSPPIMGLGLQQFPELQQQEQQQQQDEGIPPHFQQSTPVQEEADVKQYSLPPSTTTAAAQKKARRKTSFSSLFAHPSMRYRDDTASLNGESESIFKRHSMRDNKKNAGGSMKNYNYQLNNKFTPEGPVNDFQDVGGSPVVDSVVQQEQHQMGVTPNGVGENGSVLVADKTDEKVTETKKKKKNVFSFGGLFKKKNKV